MGYAGDDDAHLVEASRSGDRAAFEELVGRTYVATYTLALRLTSDEEDARDVVQDAYLRAWRSIGRFRGDSQFSTWMYRIAANCAATTTSRRRRHRTEPLDENVDRPDVTPSGRPDLVAEGSADLDRIARALEELPSRLRAVVVLKDVYDLPHAVIADELGISNAAAKVRLHRGRRRLRELLSEDEALSHAI